MSNASLQRRGPPRMVSVTPDVTDPNMRGKPKTAEEMLRDMGENPDDVRQRIFAGKNKTREEQTAQKKQPEEAGASTMLVIAFALIVICLVALIVWMVVKQNKDKTNEQNEIRARVRPAQVGGMSPLRPGGPPPQQRPVQPGPQRNVHPQQRPVQPGPQRNVHPQQRPVQPGQPVPQNRPTTQQPEVKQPQHNNDNKDTDDDLDNIIAQTNKMMSTDDDLTPEDRILAQKFDEEVMEDDSEDSEED